MNEEKNLPAILESILFVHGEPMSLDRMCAIADAEPDAVRSALAVLGKSYEGRGLILIEKDGSWQLGSHPAHTQYVEALARGEFGDALSRAALETLAVVAYKGPISRANLEYIRGVNSSFTLRALLMRGLIERVDNPKDARAHLYRTSIDFLKHLGLARMEDLPRYRELAREVIPEKISAPEDQAL
ncbi:MAG: SMC-Scp complex subunit ScpB [Candidatus Sungbacteria bacterium]|nr:SMC-Scp complex subunit ScpB [Candidatus Sungbacteria bacterium]